MSRRDDATRCLTTREIAQVRNTLRTEALRSVHAGVRLTLFNLVCCCGLRVTESITLKMGQVIVGTERPYISVCGKRGKTRRIPLWWDLGTLEDLRDWKRWRQDLGAADTDFFICRVSKGSYGFPLVRQEARSKFLRTIANILGEERAAGLTIHDARHTAITHVINKRGVNAARAFAGHSNLATTSIYAHDIDEGAVGNIFEPDHT